MCKAADEKPGKYTVALERATSTVRSIGDTQMNSGESMQDRPSPSSLLPDLLISHLSHEPGRDPFICKIRRMVQQQDRPRKAWCYCQ